MHHILKILSLQRHGNELGNASAASLSSTSSSNLRKSSTAPKCHVLVRPRDGDFVYSDRELEAMRYDVIETARAGAHGVVLGFLDRFGKIDIDKTMYFQQLSSSLDLDMTFHRAFDCLSGSLVDGLEMLIAAKVPRILTSGGRTSAFDGAEILGNLVAAAEGRTIIMAGGGINENNASTILEVCNVKEIHGSFRRRMESSATNYNPKVNFYSVEVEPTSASTKSQWDRLMTDADLIRKIRSKCDKFNGSDEMK